MKVVVFGATGKTGELTWRKAVKAGHDVTVFGRSVERRYANEWVLYGKLSKLPYK